MGARAAAALSLADDPRRAAREAAADLAATIGDRPEVVLLFASPDLLADAEAVQAGLREHLSPAHLIGCSGDGVVAGRRALSGRPALALWGACEIGAARSFDIVARPDGQGVDVAGLPGDLAEQGMTLVLLADPFTFPVDTALERVRARAPQVQVVGGLAAGGRGPGEHWMLLDNETRSDGAVGLLIDHRRTRCVVSQGCRPIGPDMVVTAVDGPVVRELAGRPALAQLRDLLETVDVPDREALGHGLLIGVVTDENRPDYAQGDYVIRGLRGTDRESGSLIAAEPLRVGQTVRFQVRDAAVAECDLRDGLERVSAEIDGPPVGALVFGCVDSAREPHGAQGPDSGAAAAVLNDCPTIGFFGNGEIGPVAGRSFLHAFSTSVLLLVPDHR